MSNKITREEKISHIYEVIWPTSSDECDICFGDVLDYLDKNCDNKYYKRKFWKLPIFDWTFTSVRNWMHIVVCNNINEDFLKRLYVSWEYKRLPIEEQRENTIDFIYSLIKE